MLKLLFSIVLVVVISCVWLVFEYSSRLTKLTYIKPTESTHTISLKISDESTNKNVYQYVDAKGNLVITNKPLVSHAKKMKLPPLAIYANPMTKNDLYAGGYTSILAPGYQSPSNIVNKWFNNRNNMIPNINDGGRRTILKEELKHEKNALADLRKLIEDSKKNRLSSESDISYLTRLENLQDNVKEHEKNIELLTRMLN
ncbi:MAG: hypothetical protein ACK5Z5_01295 [Neisseriaceae bacterium]